MYSMLLYNYRATRAVENFKEGKQMSHNKILRTVFGISTGALLFGMNMMQVPFASESIVETETQSISEENTDVINNQKLLEIDQDQLDTGVVYVTTKDTYFYFPDGCSDDANLLGWAVKWMHETWYQNSENDIDVSAKVFVMSELHCLELPHMKAMQTIQENMQFQQPLKKTVRIHSNSWIIGNHWIQMRSSQLKHVFQRKIGKRHRI